MTAVLPQPSSAAPPSSASRLMMGASMCARPTSPPSRYDAPAVARENGVTLFELAATDESLESVFSYLVRR